VLIVARGGGSLEDLWGFNEEIVVRAAAASDIPLISAVGHETDTTLIDFASDVRAPTPTAAAEMAVPVQADLLAQVSGLAARHRSGMRRMLDRQASELRGLARVLRGAEDALAVPRQRLDRAGERLQDRLRARLRDHHLRLGKLSQLLARHSPQAELARRQGALESARRDFARLGPQIVKRRAEALSGTAKLLDALGYHNVLARGFALVRDEAGQPVRSVAAIAAGSRLEVELADGRIGAVAEGEGAVARKSDKLSRKSAGGGQGTLF
jgi:exodeoxyribonuclease VII large subunit